GGRGGGGNGSVSGGYVGGGVPPRPFPIFEGLCPIQPDRLNYEATFPESAWRPDFFAQIALAEFGKTNWQSIDVRGPPTNHAVIFAEIEELLGPAMDDRDDLANEIIDQDVRLVGYFAQVLMLSPSAHPNTIKIIEMADHVGLMVAVYYKLKFNRGRPQQVCPALFPMIASPWHASYPSGHSLEGHLMALSLGEIMPGAKSALMALAARIGRNREVAGVHYPSDTAAGKEIAESVFPYLKECTTFSAVLDAAKREH
ncbi:phosphatase PAP2 family protein, partial [Bradyrhizobium sp. 147]|uniref:phosphatase PAP2 family protein n=1 Tax=Bradyrhizobium sp. 147 TaxID=2782623 RepID=UPI001FF8CE0C